MTRKDLQAFAARSWDLVTRQKETWWAERGRQLTPEEKLRIGDMLRRHVRKVRPDWPGPEERREDLETHTRVSEALSRVHRVVQWYKLGHSPEEIADRIGHLSLAQVHAALSYYHANQRQIEAEIAQEQAEAETLESARTSTHAPRRDSPSTSRVPENAPSPVSEVCRDWLRV